jgi:hypothetical protein
MPKGNPNPSPATRFIAAGDEPLSEKLTIRITPTMMAWLDSFGDRKNDTVREALAQLKKKLSKT